MRKILLGILLSSPMILAQNFVIDPATTNLKLNSDMVIDDFSVTDKITIPVSKIETYYDLETRTCTKIECDEVDSNANPTWNGFFTTTNSSEKAKILSNLIKGIGKSTAEKIVAYNLIQYRPKTWNKFTNAIRYTHEELSRRGYTADFTKEVLELYAYENAQALGYYTTTSCHQVSYSCQILVEKERKVFAYNLYKDLVVNYKGKGSNAHLYPFENEVISMVTEGSGETKLSSSTNFNSYLTSVSILNNASKVVVDISANSRNKVELPSNIMTIKTQFSNQSAIIETQISSIYASMLNSQNTMEVEYQVCAKKKLSWGNSSCKTPLASGSQKITAANQPITVAMSFTSGAKYYISYKVKMTNSNDFKTGVLASGASETYKAP